MSLNSFTHVPTSLSLSLSLSLSPLSPFAHPLCFTLYTPGCHSEEYIKLTAQHVQRNSMRPKHSTACVDSDMAPNTQDPCAGVDSLNVGGSDHQLCHVSPEPCRDSVGDQRAQVSEWCQVMSITQHPRPQQPMLSCSEPGEGMACKHKRNSRKQYRVRSNAHTETLTQSNYDAFCAPLGWTMVLSTLAGAPEQNNTCAWCFRLFSPLY